MKYDGQKLVAPNYSKVVAVWDYTVRSGSLGHERWLCKTAEGKLYMYWCLNDVVGPKVQGDWISADISWCRDIAQNSIPVWSLDNLDQSKPVESKPVEPIDTSWVIRSDGSCYYHGNQECEHRSKGP